MAAPVRAVIAEVHFFSRIAKLRADDGRSLVLTRHAAGFNEVEMRKGAWLACEVLLPAPYVLVVRPCDDPPQRYPAQNDVHRGAAWLGRLPGLDETVHPVRPPEEVPVVWLSTWQVFELPSGSRHAWGRDEAAGEGRVSSLLSEFRPRTASLRSISGRWYRLVGPPRVDLDGEYVWQMWLSLQRLKLADAKPVTNEVWSAIRTSIR
jgi:hypothetical protein